jgi:hypothetical protein
MWQAVHDVLMVFYLSFVLSSFTVTADGSNAWNGRMAKVP